MDLLLQYKFHISVFRFDLALSKPPTQYTKRIEFWCLTTTNRTPECWNCKLYSLLYLI